MSAGPDEGRPLGEEQRVQGTVMTVTGTVPAADLGRTMIHEHLAPRERSGLPPGRTPSAPLQDVGGVVRELERLRTHGVRTVVDVTPYGKGRDPEVLRDLSQRTGLHVVAATGFYKEPACPAFVHRASVDDLVRFLVDEIENGLDDTGIRPGIIKVGTSRATITTTERNVLLAAAVAHRETGLPITTHTTLGTMGREQTDLLLGEGVDPRRVVIGHSDLNREIAYHLEILKMGVTLGFDTIGKERFHYRRHREAGYERHAFLLEEHHQPDAVRLSTLLGLLEAGYASQLVLSSDLLWSEALLNLPTLGVWGYGYLWERFLPRLRDDGVDDATLETMLVVNPRRILAGDVAAVGGPR